MSDKPGRYWQRPASEIKADDLVVIHVSDEVRNVSRDFCCKRDILVKHMKYFETFLAENENGYDEIDISVHCDVEIFEWLMSYIHEPNAPLNLDKTVVASILISSEFLQMDVLVDLCLQFISNNLTDIIKLPIDLSCISDKLVNKLAMITSPKVLSETKDRKDKILNKLYKRRVELDFSRKTGARGGTKATKTIAATLSCCRHCGNVFLENYIGNLICPVADAVIDYRGKWVRRHDSIPGWSLTSYLKALHSGNMSWEAIYWHAWASCVVLQVEDVYITATEISRYLVNLEEGFLQILASANKSNSIIGSGGAAASNTKDVTFSLDLDDSFYSDMTHSDGTVVYNIYPSSFNDPAPNPSITPSLSPNRPPSVLSFDIFSLLSTQLKFIADPVCREMVDKTGKVHRSLAQNAAFGASAPQMLNDVGEFDFYTSIFKSKNTGDDNDDSADDDGPVHRSRSRSPKVPPTLNTSRKLPIPAASPKGRLTNNNASGKFSVQADAVDTGGDSDTQDKSKALSNIGLRYRKKSQAKQIADLKRRTKPRTRGKSSKGNKPPSGLETEMDAADDGNDDDLEYEELLDEVYRIYHETPSEVSGAIRNARTHYMGVWMTETHPLSLLTNAQYVALQQQVSRDPSKEPIIPVEASISKDPDDASATGGPPPVTISNRRMDALMDLVREQEAKRFLRFENFLVDQRASANPPGVEQATTTQQVANKPRRDTLIAKRREDLISNTKSLDYYKDRARQPHRGSIL